MRNVVCLLMALMILSSCSSIAVQNDDSQEVSSETEVFGLSEQERIVIWNDYVSAQDKARLEVSQSFEMINPNDPKYADLRNEFDHELYAKQFLEREDMIKLRQEKYEREVAERHGLTYEQIKEISREGMTKQWPFPPEPEGLWDE